MLKLSLTPAEPAWIELLPGVRFQVRPFTVADMYATREAARQIYANHVDGESSGDSVSSLAAFAMVRAAAHRIVLSWDGIGNEAGEPLPVSPEAIDAAIALPAIYDSFETRVFAPALSVPTA